jgi:hypothetical protein
MNCVNNGSSSGLVRRFQGSERTRGRKIYMMMVEVKEGTFWQGDEAKLLDSMITNKCGVNFGDLDCNQLGAKVDLDFLLP